MCKNKVQFCMMIVLSGVLFSCASKQLSVGEELRFDSDVCAFVPAISELKKENQEFTGESWPEKARVHSWDTAQAAAHSNCRGAGFSVCRHLPAKDVKGSTGKTSGPGQYYYQATVLGEKVVEVARDHALIQRDQCSALQSCMAQQKASRKSQSEIQKTQERITQHCAN